MVPVVWTAAEDSASRRLIIRLIIQTIRPDPIGSDQIDEAPKVSRPDPSGADEIDAEHQATDLVLELPPRDGSSSLHGGVLGLSTL
jgi:hypothetical protein